MNTCSHFQNLIFPYLDGELSHQEKREVEEHVLSCQNCNDILQAQKRFLALLDSPALQERGSAELKAKISLQLEPQTTSSFTLSSLFSCRMVAGYALTVALLTLMFTTFIPDKQSSPGFIENTVASHKHFLQNSIPFDMEDTDPKAVSRWIRKQIGTGPDFPEFDDRNVILLGGRIDHYKGQSIGFISYMIHDIPVTLVVAPKTPQTDIQTDQHTYVGARRINFMNTGGLNVVSWSVCDNNFALISSLPHKGKKGCTVCHANGSGLMDLSEFYSRS